MTASGGLDYQRLRLLTVADVVLGFSLTQYDQIGVSSDGHGNCVPLHTISTTTTEAEAATCTQPQR